MGSTSLSALLRAQLKVTRFRSRNTLTYWAKIVAMLLVLAAIVVCSLVFGWTIRSSDGLIAGIAIFAGGFLTAFTHLAAVRRTLDARHAQQEGAERPERDLVDIAVTRLLGATLVSAATRSSRSGRRSGARRSALKSPRRTATVYPSRCRNSIPSRRSRRRFGG